MQEQVVLCQPGSQAMREEGQLGISRTLSVSHSLAVSSGLWWWCCLLTAHTVTWFCCVHILIARSPLPHSLSQWIPTDIGNRKSELISDSLRSSQSPSLEPKPQKPCPFSQHPVVFLKNCHLPHQVQLNLVASGWPHLMILNIGIGTSCQAFLGSSLITYCTCW